MKNKITKSIITLSTLTFLYSCGPQGRDIQYEGEVVEQTQEEIKSSNQPKKLNFALGQDMKLGDFVIKLNKITDYKSTNKFMQPEEGNKYVAIEVEYFNPTQNKQLDANPMNWTLFDNEDYSYDIAIMGDKKPELNAKTINPGGKLKGWVTFEIPKSSNPKKVQFQPDFWDNANIEITLN